jgi:hypothetical protein
MPDADRMNKPYPLVRIPTVPAGLTLFVVLAFGGLILGVLVGFAVGHAFGLIGTIAGGVLGGCVGYALGVLPGFLVEQSLFKDMQMKSNAELKAVVDEKNWTFLQTLALMNLAARDEDVKSYLPRVMDMLESDSARTRLFGWDALRLVYTGLAMQIDDYDPHAPVEMCRNMTATLRSSGAAALALPQKNE